MRYRWRTGVLARAGAPTDDESHALQSVLTPQGATPREGTARQPLCADIEGVGLPTALRGEANDGQRLEPLAAVPPKEPPFIARTAAWTSASAARIVFASGFESIRFDLNNQAAGEAAGAGQHEVEVARAHRRRR